MAIDVAAFVTNEITEGNSTLMDDLLALNPDASAAEVLAGAQMLADLAGRALLHVKDNAIAVDGTAGSDDLDID